MIIDCDRKRDHTPVTCDVIDAVSDSSVGGVKIITYDSSLLRSISIAVCQPIVVTRC